jgi:hypothetical protein
MFSNSRVEASPRTLFLFFLGKVSTDDLLGASGHSKLSLLNERGIHGKIVVQAFLFIHAFPKQLYP